MSVILSKHGSVRGLEGGVGKAVDSIREKTKRLNVSSVLQRIQEVCWVYLCMDDHRCEQLVFVYGRSCVISLYLCMGDHWCDEPVFVYG